MSPSKTLPTEWRSRPPFTTAQCDALFDRVLVDDEIDLATETLPPVHFDYTQDQLIECFRICHQVWATGVERAAFDRTIAHLYAARQLDPAEQLAFKYARARFKQLRFAYANADARHRYPPRFNFITAVMGHLQDDFKNGRRAAVGWRALLVRLLLTRPAYAALEREFDGLVPTTAERFRNYIIGEMETIRSRLARAHTAGKDFHAIRKIVSRQASLFVGLATLYPSKYHDDVFKYLSVINGLMGRYHDELIVRRHSGQQDYAADKFAFPAEIRRRLEVLTSRYPFPDAASNALAR